MLDQVVFTMQQKLKSQTLKNFFVQKFGYEPGFDKLRQAYGSM